MKLIQGFILSIGLCFLLGIFISASVSQTDDILEWKQGVKLTWADFQGDSDSLSTYKAKTFTKIALKYDVSDDQIILNLPCHFSRKLSWSKNKQSAALLRHEQLHFDIAELAARNIRAKYTFHVSKKLSETSVFFQNTYDRYSQTFRDSLNKKYDTETAHGTIADKQTKWEVKITSELKKLDKYASSTVTVKRVK